MGIFPSIETGRDLPQGSRSTRARDYTDSSPLCEVGVSHKSQLHETFCDLDQMDFSAAESPQAVRCWPPTPAKRVMTGARSLRKADWIVLPTTSASRQILITGITRMSASAHRHDRAAAVRHIDLIWPTISWSGAAVSPRGADPHGQRQPDEHRLAAAPYLAEPAAIRPRRSGRKIWSMTSAPVVITGRSSRR